MSLTTLLHHPLDVLFPYRCLVCGRNTFASLLCVNCTPKPISSAPRCSRCYSELETFDEIFCSACSCKTPLFNSIRYLWNYEGAAQALIVAMKYRPSVRLCYLAASILAESMPSLYHTPKWEIIVPIPASAASMSTRLFNQCDILAQQIKWCWVEFSMANNLSANLVEIQHSLRHNGSRCPQASLKHTARFANVKNAFSANPSQVKGKNILLIDDVVTTGATTASAARALLDSGAAKVDLLALARAKVWLRFRFKTGSYTRRQ